jgi:hypothetical protein
LYVIRLKSMYVTSTATQDLQDCKDCASFVTFLTLIRIHSPMKMEQTQCSETSAIKHHTPENNRKGYTRLCNFCSYSFLSSAVNCKYYLTLIHYCHI